MKILRGLLLFFIILFSQTSIAQMGDTSFYKEWLDIDTTLTIQQLPKTALEKVNLLYPKTIKANLGAQQLKCMIYQLTLETAIQESIEIPAINRVKKELKSQKDSLTRMLLLAILAKQYKQYFYQNQWKISGRTPNTGALQQPVTLWGMADFHRAIRQAYREALSKPTLLQKTPAMALAAISIPGSNAAKPDNWWELLLMEQLAYEKNPIGEMPSSGGLSKWFNLAISEPVTFQQSMLPANDSGSLVVVLKIYQQLIASKEKKKQPGNSVQLHIDRIEWAWEKSNHASALRGAYLQSLQKIYATYPEQPAALRAAYLMAQMYLSNNTGRSEINYKQTGINPQLEAEKILSDAVKRFVVPIAETQPLQSLLTQIRSQQMNALMEMVYVPNQPILSAIRYRNTTQAYIRVVSLNNSEWEKLNSFQIEKKPDPSLFNKSFLQEKNWKLPASVDRLEHTTEIKIDPLPTGKYLLIAATQNDLFNNECAISITPFQVSNISLLQLDNDWYALNRESGLPISGAFFQFYNRNYSGNQIRYEPISGASGTTKQDGTFSFQKPGGYYDCIRIKFQQDELWLNESVYGNQFSVEQINQTPKKEAVPNMLLYTDRKIYRPAQIVFWKGIGLGITNEKNSKSELLPAGTPATVYLKDANNQAIDSVTVKLNSFGSCSGQFVLPSKGLTGRFTIVAKGFVMSDENSIRMEEYKRPAFSIEWKKINTTYRLNDSIPVSGSAIAYAGNKMQGIPVQYSIQKQPRWLPYWNQQSGAYTSSNRNKEIISSGTTQTDENGDFHITIPAPTDSLDVDAANKFYQYLVTVNITNGNGESQSKQLTVPVSSQSLFVHWELAEKMLPEEWKNSKLFTENITAQKLNTPVTLSIYKLTVPTNTYRKRYWPIPDEQIMSEETFRTAFPLDAYRDETNVLDWKISDTIRSDKFISTLNGDFISRGQLLRAGTYRLETIVTDTISGKLVKDVQIVEIVDPGIFSGTIPYQQKTISFQNTAEKITGDTLQAASFTNNGPKYIIEYWQTPDTTLATSKQMDSNNPIAVIRRTSKEPGLYYYSRAGIFQNRIFEVSYQWIVKAKSNNLSITASSFRDKTLPGSLERWTVEIRDTGKTLPVAELLSSMYDASLDQIIPFQWKTLQVIEPYNYPGKFSFSHNFKSINSLIYYESEIRNTDYPPAIYTQLAGDAYAIINQNRERTVNGKLLMLPYQYNFLTSGEPLSEMVVAADVVMKNPTVAYSSKPGINLPNPPVSNEELQTNSSENGASLAKVNLRKNLSETAFFFPHVLADSNGKYTISFTMPESLTRWKWQNLAHTRSGIFGSFSTEIITQKSLMVLPGLPRLLREGDGIELTSQVANLGDSELTGVVVMELVDASTEKPVDGWFQNVFPQQYFTVGAGKTETIRFPLQVPFGFNKPLKIRIKAKAGKYEDGEENILPVITNRVLVTESKSFWIAKDTSLSLQLPNLLRSNSPSITHESFQFEIATQPAWYVVKSLPHLIQNTNPTTEQIWNRLMANQLASYTLSEFPIIASTLEEWKKDTTALQSTFTKNQSLQSVLMEETPWVQQSQSEAEQLQSLSILLDSIQLKNENAISLTELKAAQLSSGGFRWMDGDREDLTTTLYILNGMAQLTQLKAWQPDVKPAIDQVSVRALQYADTSFNQFYRDILQKKNSNTDILIPQQWIAYAWMRKQFPNISNATAEGLEKIIVQLTKNWQRYDLLAQTWIAQLALNSGAKDIAIKQILPSLFEKGVRDSSMGMYWKFFPQTNGYYSKMTMQSRMFVLFKLLPLEEQQQYQSYLQEMIQWVLQQRKSNHWINTPATADACFSLLTILPKTYLNNPSKITIQTGELTYQATPEKSEAGTGYFKQRIDGKKVSASLGKIKITTASERKSDTLSTVSSPVTGAFYWQYFEDIQQIKSFQHPSLALQKTLFRKKLVGNNISLEPITTLTSLKRGDQVVIRLTITCKQPMDYVYLKDMRGAGMEPVDIVSKYKNQDGLGYYQTTRDAYTGFFIRHLEKGIYIVDYPLTITHLGSFAGGIAQIECLYAPEYRAHAANTPFRVAE